MKPVKRSVAVVVRPAGAPDGGAPQTVAPEYDDCRAAALEHRAPIKLVIEAALAAARRALD